MNTRKLKWISTVLTAASMLILSACSAISGADIPSPGVTEVPTMSATRTPEATVTPTPIPTATPQPTAIPTPTPVTHEDGPQTIGIYKRVSGGYQRLPDLIGKWVKGKDICDLYTYASSEDFIKGSSVENIFKDNWNSYTNASDFKIGYCVNFTLKSSEVVNLTIRSPKDAPKDPNAYFYQYVEVYMYDNLVPKNGPKRMHLVESKMKDTTMLTSIKLTSGSKIAQVESLSLTAFVYKDDNDFDPVTGSYIGNVSYTLPISQEALPTTATNQEQTESNN